VRAMPGVDQTVAFGETTHVTGKDAGLLERSLHEAIAGTPSRLERIDTSLEDVFIHLMKGATDNWGEDAQKASDAKRAKSGSAQ